MSKLLQKAAVSRVPREAAAKDSSSSAAASKAGIGKKRKVNTHEEREDDGAEIVVERSSKKVKLDANLRPLSDAKPSPGKKGQGKSGTETSDKSSVIYLGHIPNGFFETEMRKFFIQFGAVKRLKLFRSKKTNNSKGYAFVEFESPQVAEVVSEAMQGYFLMERQLVSHVVPVEKLHKGMFTASSLRNAHKNNDAGGDEDGDEDGEEEELTKERFAELSAQQKKIMEKKQAKLRKLGIDFTIPFGSLAGGSPQTSAVDNSTSNAASDEISADLIVNTKAKAAARVPAVKKNSVSGGRKSSVPKVTEKKSEGNNPKESTQTKTKTAAKKTSRR